MSNTKGDAVIIKEGLVHLGDCIERASKTIAFAIEKAANKPVEIPVRLAPRHGTGASAPHWVCAGPDSRRDHEAVRVPLGQACHVCGGRNADGN